MAKSAPPADEKINMARVHAALAGTVGHNTRKGSGRSEHSWFAIKKRFQALTDAELAEAEALERLERRNENLLRLMDLEKRRRRGDKSKIRRMTAEVKL